MATPQPHELGIYYTSKDLTVDNAAVPDRVAGDQSTILNIHVPALNNPTDFWNGATGVFIGENTTISLRGRFFHVRKWDNATKMLAIAQPLPTLPAAGDTFKLMAGGRTASGLEVFGMKVAGKQPEIEKVVGSTVTGVAIKKASGLLGEGTLTLSCVNRNLSIRMRSGGAGPLTEITADATNVPVYNSDLSGYILVDVVYASLATANRSDTFTLSAPKQNLVPNFEGYETNDGIGRTRYHLFAARNKATSDLDSMTAFSIRTGRPIGNTSTLSGNFALYTETPGMLNVVNASNWPTRGFWIRNKTANSGNGDVRYVDYRSGNTLYTKPVTWGYVPFRNGTAEIRQGMTMTGNVETSNAIVDQVILDGGTWVGGNATGTLILKRFKGSFTNNEALKIDGTQVATASAASSRGFRGFTAVSWYSGNVIVPVSDIDIGINVPTGSVYKNPANENLIPDGVTFGLHDSQEEALIIDAIQAGKAVGIWTRETILDGTQARQDVDGSLFCAWY